MTKFLQLIFSKNKASIILASSTAFVSICSVWNFDIQKLTQTGALAPLAQWQIRTGTTLLLLLIYSFSLIFILLISYHRDHIEHSENQLEQTEEEYKNQKVDPRVKEYSDLAKILENISIQIPSIALNGEAPTTNNLYSIFINIQNSLVTGISNKNGQPEKVYWMFNIICPKLLIHGLVNKVIVPGTNFDTFIIEQKGKDFLAYIDKKKHIKEK